MIIETALCLSIGLDAGRAKAEMMAEIRKAEEAKFHIMTEEESEREREKMFRLLLEEVQKGMPPR